MIVGGRFGRRPRIVAAGALGRAALADVFVGLFDTWK